MKNKNMTYKKVIWIIIGLLIAASPHMLYAENIEEAYSKILLNETDMPGYELGFQNKYFWGISDSISKEGIVQIWNNEGIRIEVFYCKFDSATEALYGTEYYSSTFSVFFPFGSFYGPIVGDESWFAEERSDAKAIIFIRGNVGIHINSIITGEENLNITKEIIHKVLDKIEENLDEEIILKEQDVRERQITDTRYLQITEDTIKSETMTGYSFFSDWDSKWLVDENNFLMGKRMEWVNARGSLIGIDIFEFDSEESAHSAVEIKTRPIESGVIKTPSFDLNDLSTLDLLIKDWPGVFSNKFISGICFEGKTALHVYQFDPEKINTEEFKTIATKLATTLSF